MACLVEMLVLAFVLEEYEGKGNAPPPLKGVRIDNLFSFLLSFTPAKKGQLANISKRHV